MSDDPMTATLLTEYEATADNLQHGVNVSTETMQRYHGMTGRLLAQTIRSLWSQQELDAQIDARVSARCATCGKTAAAPASLTGILTQNAKTIIVCITILGSVACLTGNFDKLMEGVLKLRVSHMTALP